jgi:hypothetical protein
MKNSAIERKALLVVGILAAFSWSGADAHASSGNINCSYPSRVVLTMNWPVPAVSQDRLGNSQIHLARWSGAFNHQHLYSSSGGYFTADPNGWYYCA